MTTQQLPILIIVQTDSPFARFVIEDQATGQTWTGEQFGPENPAMYANINKAAMDANQILKDQFNGDEPVEPVKYCVPLFVEVYSRRPVEIAEVADYLSKAAVFSINTTQNGNGPKGQLVVTTIPWHRIEQIKEIPND